jgi:spermidine synthase
MYNQMSSLNPSSSDASHYDGRLVFSCRDEEGPIEVVDEAAARTLHFGTVARQTTMFRRAPAKLALAYTHCMMASLLFMPQPRSVLILGLGGGALVRFLLDSFAACRIEVVERRLKIIEIARDYFGLPQDDRLKVHWCDAEEFLAQGKKGRGFDLVLVDLHDSQGMAPVTRSPFFFETCRRHLAPAGILAANLWGGGDQAETRLMQRRLVAAFPQRVLHLPVAAKRNRVAFGFGADFVRLSPVQIQRRGRDLQQRHEIDFPSLWRQLVRTNPGRFMML